MDDGTGPGPAQAKRPQASGVRQVASLAVVAALALLAFLLLLDVLLAYDEPVVGWLVPLLPRGAWIAILLALLGLLLALQLVLLRLGAKAVPPTLQAIAQEFVALVQPAAAAGAEVLLVGCPACGTAFEHAEGEGTFECPNCRRTGRLQPGAPRSHAHVRQLACSRCGNGFLAYREGAECPVCHTPQAADT